MNKFHFSTTECFDSCPYQFKLRYLGDIDTVPTDDPQSPLKLGTAIHRAMETDIETAVNEYLMCYPVIDDRHINEVIKMEYWIPKLKELLPEGIHELNFSNKVYEGTADLLVPVGKHEQMETALCGGKVLCQYKSYDLYDFKYSNNIDHYIESRQLHVYKHYLEKIKSVYIRRMFFVFVPKVMIKQKKTESIEQFRQRLKSELKQKEIQIKEIVFDQSKVDDFHETCMEIGLTTEFQKNQSQLCKWCQYQEFCERGVDYMLLPSAERRVINKVTKRKIWIYGMPMSGKTYMADTFPSPINLNTDGNVQFVTMALLPIKDTYEGRQKIPAWQVFKNAIDELERTAEENDFKTLVADLTEDLYESCRLFMYDKLGITHESDDSFRAWDKVRTEFLSTMRKFMNLDYENILLLSHEDKTKDITKKTGDKVTAIKPNIPDKIATKLAGMVDITCRAVKDNGEYFISFKTDDVVFGGGRLKTPSEDIPNTFDAICKVYDEVNSTVNAPKKEEDVQQKETPVQQENPEKLSPAASEDVPRKEVTEETPVRTRRTRKVRE